jgi:hypothetical protein
MQLFLRLVGEMIQLKVLFLGIFYKREAPKGKMGVDEKIKKRYAICRL